MHAVTIDTNCIIELAQGTKQGQIIHRLIELHQGQRMQLRVPGISASEKQLDHTYLPTFDLFKQKLIEIGLDKVEILRPIAYLGVCYLEWCVLPSEEMITLERSIHNILFPNVPFEYADFCRQQNISLSDDLHPKWRNAKCDTLGLWSHIYYSGNIFVTIDKNFHKATKRSRLIDCGAGAIVKPEEVLQYLS